MPRTSLDAGTWFLGHCAPWAQMDCETLQSQVSRMVGKIEVEGHSLGRAEMLGHEGVEQPHRGWTSWS